MVEVPPAQPELPLPAMEAQPAGETPTTTPPAEVESETAPTAEPPLEAAVPTADALVQHAGAWLLLGMLRKLGFYDLLARRSSVR